MTDINRHIESYAGDGLAPDITITGADGNALNISSADDVVWQVRDGDGNVVLTKSLGDGLEFSNLVTNGTDGKVTVTIDGDETSDLSGWYSHECVITFGGQPSTVVTGIWIVGVAAKGE